MNIREIIPTTCHFLTDKPNVVRQVVIDYSLDCKGVSGMLGKNSSTISTPGVYTMKALLNKLVQSGVELKNLSFKGLLENEFDILKSFKL